MASPRPFAKGRRSLFFFAVQQIRDLIDDGLAIVRIRRVERPDRRSLGGRDRGQR
jgi:hypothetical protein